MSQAFNVVTAHRIPEKTSRTSSRNISLTLVVLMFVAGAALSLVSLALPDWVFQPTNATTFPLT
jgi:hypothetical protein